MKVSSGGSTTPGGRWHRTDVMAESHMFNDDDHVVVVVVIIIVVVFDEDEEMMITDTKPGVNFPVDGQDYGW